MKLPVPYLLIAISVCIAAGLPAAVESGRPPACLSSEREQSAQQLLNQQLQTRPPRGDIADIPMFESFTAQRERWKREVTPLAEDAIQGILKLAAVESQQEEPNWRTLYLLLQAVGLPQADERIREFGFAILRCPSAGSPSTDEVSCRIGAITLVSQQWSPESRDMLVHLMATGIPKANRRVTKQLRKSIPVDFRHQLAGNSISKAIWWAPYREIESTLRKAQKKAPKAFKSAIESSLEIARKADSGDPNPFGAIP